MNIALKKWELTEVFGRFCDSNKELDSKFFRAFFLSNYFKDLRFNYICTSTHTTHLYKLPVTVGYMSGPAPLNINIACAANSKGSIFAPGILLLLALKGL